MKYSVINDDKAIVCSDLHIRDYTEYNPNEKQLKDSEINPLGFSNPNEYRLNQILMIAYRIIFECNFYKTKTVFILGDLIDKPNSQPIVINTIKLFVKLLTDAGLTIYYILGQHDNRTRKTDVDIRKDSWIGTLRNSKFKYVHKKQFSMGKQIIEFKNFDFSNECKFKDNSTVLLGHISLGMGQTPVGKSAKLCVAGDIHDDVNKVINGIQCYSCMTPFVIYPHQSMNGYIGLLDCSNDIPMYKRISSNGLITVDNVEKTFKLFDILQSVDYKNSILNQQLEDIKNKQISIDSEDTDNLSGKFDIRNLVNIENTVKEIAIENHFEDLFSELVLTEQPKPLDFNFHLKTFDIENFRSIKKQHIDFSNLQGITFLSGKTGSGKSSILRALETVLKGNNRIKTLLRKKESQLLLDLVLEYHNSEYEIIRKVSKTELYKNGEKFELGKKETEQKILEELPFISYLDYFICHANSHFFDNVDRTQLIMDIFNLNSLNYYCESIEDLQDDIKEEIKSKTIDKVTYENQLKDLQDDITNIKDKIKSLSTNNGKIFNDAKQRLSELSKLNNDINSSKSLCDTYKNNINDYKKSIEQFSDEDKYSKAVNCLNEIKSFEVLQSKISNEQSLIKTKKSELTSQITIRQKLISTPKCECPECHHKFYLNGLDDKIKEYDIDIKQKETEITKLENELDFIQQGLQSVETEYSKNECEKIISNYNSSKMLVNQLDNMKKQYEDEKQKGSSTYSIKQTLIQSSGFKTEEDYINQLNYSIEYLIKKDSYTSELNSAKDKLLKYKDKLDNTNTKLKQLNKKLNKCEKFRLLFDMENLNSIPYKIIKKVIHSLDNDKIHFTSTKELANGEDRFAINAEINVDGEWIDYDSSSDGQHVILDSFILYSVLINLTNVGLLIFDEYMANLDNDYVAFVSTVIEKMKRYSSNILITSHSDYFSKYDNLLSLQLVNGITEIN